MNRCNSCLLDIQPNQSTVNCSVCSKPIHKECAINKDGTTFCDTCYTSKTEDDNNPKLQFEIPPFIRRSYIETYISCPYKFYNQVILEHEQPENIYTKLGIDLHELFNKASNHPEYFKVDMINDFYTLYYAYPETLFEDDTIHKTMEVRALDSIDTFYEVTKFMPQPFKTEETLQFSVGDDLPLVQCTSDRVNLVDGELEMIDWKTGNVMVGMNLSTDLQAPIYINSVREKYKMPVRKFTFYYLKDNKERVFERVDYDNYSCMVGKRKYNINITDSLRKVQHTFSQIKKGNFNIPIETKKMYYTCKMCHIKEMGLCEGADIRVWQQYSK